jgi:hypothetical protein
MKNIALLGAVDRFNYGDLLFPYIIRNAFSQLKDNCEIKYEVFGIVESDLSRIGAMSTKSYQDFIHYIVTTPNINIIIVGGETMSAGWLNLYSYIFPFFKYVCKLDILLHYKLNFLFEKLLIRPLTKYPFVINKSDFKNITTLAYNAVGGGINQKNKIISYLKTATYISVRNKNDYRVLQENHLNVNLVSDTAILMSNFWDIPKLETLISKDLQRPQEYLFFQVNYCFFKKNRRMMIPVLTELYNRFQIPILLCPIGLALGHEDNVGLQWLDERLNIPHFYVSQPNLWDIMYCIAKSSLYIGTSLHGIITAMSFNTPYIGLNLSTKISEHLNTWAIDELKDAVNMENLIEQTHRILSADLYEKLDYSSSNMKNQSMESLTKIYHLLR